MRLTGRILRQARRLTRRTARSLVRPWLTAERIAADLEALGVRRGGVLLVHSSLSAMGHVVGGAPTVVRALIESVGPDGTLVLPTHTWRQMQAGCREFDVRASAGCVGAIPECFRQRDGVVRSLHPSHSVAAIGPLAGWLTAGHERSETPCGEGTPYAKLLDGDGQILLLGVGLASNTAFHAVEALAHAPYLMNDAPDRFSITDASGVTRDVLVNRHRAGIPRRFDSFEQLLADRGVLRVGRVGKARSRLVAGRAFRDVMLEAMAGDPALLLAGRGRSG